MSVGESGFRERDSRAFDLAVMEIPRRWAVSICNSLCDCWGEQAVIEITFFAHIVFVNIQRQRKRQIPNLTGGRQKQPSGQFVKCRAKGTCRTLRLALDFSSGRCTKLYFLEHKDAQLFGRFRVYRHMLHGLVAVPKSGLLRRSPLPT